MRPSEFLDFEVFYSLSIKDASLEVESLSWKEKERKVILLFLKYSLKHLKMFTIQNDQTINFHQMKWNNYFKMICTWNCSTIFCFQKCFSPNKICIFLFSIFIEEFSNSCLISLHSYLWKWFASISSFSSERQFSSKSWK